MKPDPRGVEELEAGRRLEATWAANAERIAAAARLKAAAGFWAAVEGRRGADNNGAPVTELRLASRRPAEALAHSGSYTSGGSRPNRRTEHGKRRDS